MAQRGTLGTSDQSVRKLTLILQGQWWDFNSFLLLTWMINERADPLWALEISFILCFLLSCDLFNFFIEGERFMLLLHLSSCKTIPGF